MLISKKVILKWNSKIKKHYVDLGYKYTKMNDEFAVSVCDLTHGSAVKILCKCDYCHKLYTIPYASYYQLKKKKNNKDCCRDSKCTGQKAQESLLLLHGVKNCRYIPGVNEKIKQTNFKKYGCDNPFANNKIKDKIKETNIKKYGVPYSMQNKKVKERANQTCLEKYGVINYGIIYSKTHTGDKASNWKGDNVKHTRLDRGKPEYRQWRKLVFNRDLYTCQCCGDKNGNGHEVYLEAHHIYNYKDFPDKRFDVNNGTTLCRRCHTLFHSIYGKKNNTKQQFDEFLNQQTDKKIC